MSQHVIDETSAGPGGAGLDDRIAAAVDNWKRKLLDLTKRNRLLSFRVNRVTTITVVDELPSEVFRQLYIAERPMRFRAAPEPTEAGGSGGDAARTGLARRARGAPGDVATGLAQRPPGPTGDPDAALDAPLFESADAALAAHDGAGEEFSPYDRASVEDRHRDDWLQTTSPPEALDRSLRRIDEQARLTLEEQGVNTLFLTMGMLHYTESAESGDVYRAPLVLLPTELSRKSARSGYELRVADDEPLVNPALAEQLRRLGFALPALPESDAMADDYDLQTFFEEVKAAVADRPNWSVRTDLHLGLFSFQKFVMFKDLDANVAAVAQHRLTRQLIARTGGQVIGLPDDVRRIALDAEYPPEASFQVVDADSSQLRAMAACARGHDLVIEGPPGTGKSQTITNLIAQALADGRSVLFVAEKMAALAVVHARLQAAGLGEFCLELHSSKASKRAVMQDLAATLDASLQRVASTSSAGERLPQVRAELTNYANALHEPFGALGMTPYHAYGVLGGVRTAPSVAFTRAVDDVSRADVERTVRDLDDYAVNAVPLGAAAEHPWRDSTRTFYTELDLEDVARRARDVQVAAAALLSDAATTASAFGLPPIQRLADVEAATRVGAVLARSPGASLNVLQSDAWNSPPAAATRVIELGRELAKQRGRVNGWFTAEVVELEHGDDIAFIEQKLGGTFGFLALLNGRYRAVARRWKSYRQPSYAKSLIEQAGDMKAVDRLRVARAQLAEREAAAGELFGALWHGEQSDWDALDAYVGWVVEFRRTCVDHGVERQAYELATLRSPDTSALDRLADAAAGFRTKLRALGAQIGWPEQYLEDAPIAAAAARVHALEADVLRGPQWAAFERSRQTVAAGLAAELLPAAASGALEPADMSRAFLRAFYMRWLGLVVQQRAPLERFQSLTHEQRVREFRELDRRVLRENQTALVQRLRDTAQLRLREDAAREGLAPLQRQLSRQRNIAPLRRTMRTSGAAIRAIKPCFMMSPMTVAQMLDGTAPAFDLVIFDEASQLPTEDAVGAVIRGRQLVVVGDPKQLPPTNFFAVASGQVAAEVDDDGNPVFDDSESILEEFMGAGVPMSRLKWHYRSAHESLIAFSNLTFYDADLHTFPSVDTDTTQLGLQFEHVPDGRYEGKGLNAAEARRVSDEVVRFAQEQAAREKAGAAPLSLGVGTFNLRQQLAIQDELERRRREEPALEPFFSRSASEPFFVKNLENIQGDERDVIFLSVTYGPGSDGRIRYNFGPLNGENGWRRLNVLITRARQRMRVFSSMRGDEIAPASAGSDGPRLLREFLLFAEHGRLEGTTVGTLADAESPFERDVAAELMRRGFAVVPQVGTSAYRIDLGVLDAGQPGRFLCGIECDGVAYHASETARDRDRLRQQVLEARGWTIHRVWSTDWFKDRQGQVERLVQLVEASRTQPAAPEPAMHEVSRPVDAAVDDGDGAADYRRPTAPPYVRAEPARPPGAPDVLTAPASVLAQVITDVVGVEAPIHAEELFQRVAAVWGTRMGSRVRARIESAAADAVRRGSVSRDGDFFWGQDRACALRSRAVVRMAAERIAREEYEQALLAVLAEGHAFLRPQLVAEARAVLGFSRTGAALEEAIGAVLDRMLEEGRVGESSGGIRLRR